MVSARRPSNHSIRSPGTTTRAKIILLGLGVVLAFGGAELLLRLFWTPTVTVHAETRGEHPDYGFAPLAGATGRFARTEYNVEFRHSAQRMRTDKIIKAERGPGTRARVLFLGDSFTYSIGTELEDSFTSRIAARWPDVEVINAACTGYGQREELAVLDKLGGALKPEVVVISFFWNDVEDILRPEPAYSLNPEGKVRRTHPPATESAPLALWPAQTSLPQSRWKTCYLFEIFRETTAAFRRKHADKMRPNQITALQQMDDAWQLLDEQFRLIKLRADEIGTKLLVIHIPDYNLVNPESVISSVKPLNFNTAGQLAQICAKHGIVMHDALPAFKTAFESRGGVAGTRAFPLYYETDRHLTVAGNAVMAEFLAPILEKILPARSSK